MNGRAPALPALLALLALLALACVLPGGLAAQAGVAEQLEGRVPPEVARAVGDIARGAAARGLPVQPLVEKAMEGGAKGVPADRIIGAVRALADRLAEAMGALREGGVATPGAEAVEGGAYALTAGLGASRVRDLARLSRPPYDPALTLRVAATLAALGVPPERSLSLVKSMITTGQPIGDLLGLPSQVQLGVAGGATPAQAAEGLARAAAEAPANRPAHEVPPGQRNPHKP